MAPASPGKSHWAQETKWAVPGHFSTQDCCGRCPPVARTWSELPPSPFWSHLQLRTDQRKRCSHAHSHPRPLPGTAGLSLPRPGLYHTQRGDSPSEEHQYTASVPRGPRPAPRLQRRRSHTWPRLQRPELGMRRALGFMAMGSRE